MITFDALEQVNTKPFELIGADTGRHSRAGLIEIGIDVGFAELPHRHAGDGDRFEQRFAIAGCRNGGVKLVDMASKGSQLICRLRAASRFAEQLRSQGKCLIRADDNSAGLARGDPKRFLAGEKRCDLAGRR